MNDDYVSKEEAKKYIEEIKKAGMLYLAEVKKKSSSILARSLIMVDKNGRK